MNQCRAAPLSNITKKNGDNNKKSHWALITICPCSPAAQMCILRYSTDRILAKLLKQWSDTVVGNFDLSETEQEKAFCFSVVASVKNLPSQWMIASIFQERIFACFLPFAMCFEGESQALKDPVYSSAHCWIISTGAATKTEPGPVLITWFCFYIAGYVLKKRGKKCLWRKTHGSAGVEGHLSVAELSMEHKGTVWRRGTQELFLEGTEYQVILAGQIQKADDWTKTQGPKVVKQHHFCQVIHLYKRPFQRPQSK